MRVQPVTPDGAVEHVVERVLATDGTVRVLVDGHPSTGTAAFADATVAPLRAAGRPVARVAVRDFLRARSVRLESGRRDPDALLDAWIDVEALNREVLTSVVRRGRWLPGLRDPDTGRSTRAAYEDAPRGTVVVLDGTLALRRGLDVDLTVHLALTVAAETRATPLDDAWQLAAYGRYRREVQPERRADVVVRVDHPDRPALVLR
ncbi:uridine kinase [Isoptericola jiangsuensis]|uniref:uridine kinase n=1 Tax=Isoptericola jiangsuensis TaxID=548579 RepID=UPI000BF66DE5|nr:uridine kinase [Isoptericola jiangsuensis]